MSALSLPIPADPIPRLIALVQADAASIFTHGHKDVILARAPGRLDVMGGITDSTGGLVCAMPLGAAAAVALQRRDDRKLVIKTYNDQASGGDTQSRVELSLDDFYGSASLLPDATLQNLFTGGRHWAAYIAGAFPTLARHKKFTRRTHGANIACYSDVPFGVGLGSSAAVATAALFALTDAFHLILDPLEIAVLAQKLEQHIVGPRPNPPPRGIMDQVTSVLGKQNQLLLLKCQPHEIQGYLPVPAGYLFAGINAGIPPSLDNSGYRAARASALMAQAIITGIYRDFGQKKDPTNGYLANVPLDLFAKYLRPLLPENVSGKQFLEQFGASIHRGAMIEPQLMYEPRTAADHHIYENARTLAFVNHLRALTAAGDPATQKSLATAAGQLMFESHNSYSQNVHLGSPATDLLVQLVTQRGPDRGFFGARIIGAGSGGSVGIFAQSTPKVLEELQSICNEYQAQTGHAPQLLTTSSPGAADTVPIKMAQASLFMAK